MKVPLRPNHSKTLHQCMSFKATSSIPHLCIIQLFNQKWRIHCYNQWLNMLLDKVFKFKLCTKPHLAALTSTHQTSHQSSPDTCLELASTVAIYFQTRLCMLKLSNHSKIMQPQIKHRDPSHKLSASKKPHKHQDLHRFCSGIPIKPVISSSHSNVIIKAMNGVWHLYTQ
jgi:hypothetical protein